MLQLIKKERGIMAICQTDSVTLMEQLSNMPSGQERGKLRIYFGYAAGVGKTYAMLNDAHEAKSSGVDVIAGYIEPHARPETIALLAGLETLPPLKLSYKGIQLREFDLDRALQRKPELILVDELAHTNAAGCRHKKRYQDVEELLQAGIDVYTTINVQHIESLNDIVEAITGIYVRERIPDGVFDNADQIELVDIEPNDLIERLNKGKIYSENQAQRALENFFTREKLIALREISLRKTADQVNRIAIQGESDKNNNPYTNEHILVCLSPSPSNERVIRTAARMAEAFHGTFTALFVETPGNKEPEDKNMTALRKNLRLAEQLGAQISTVYGEDISGQIAEYAKVSRVSKIVMGRSAHSKRWWKANFVDRLTELAPAIDIYIIPDTQPSIKEHSFKITKPRLSIADTSKAITILVLCTLMGFLFDYHNFSVANIITVYILGVQLNAVVTKGRLYSAISSVLSVLIFNYFFTEPLYSLHAFDPGYPVTFLIMLSAALITSTLTKQIQEQARQSAQKAYRTEVLLETSQKLQQAKDKEDILVETAHQMVKLLDRTIVVYLADQDRLSEPMVFPDESKAKIASQGYIDKQERAVAEWVFKNNKRAGATSDTLSAARCLYLAVRSGGKVLAVAGIAMDRDAPLEAFEKSIFIAMLGECALALEKELLRETQQKISMQMQQEQLRANLLRAISHDLRTPLTSISGNAGILMGNEKVLSEEQRKGLYADIYDDSIWLINLVENLLSITRIDNGTVSLNMQPELLDEVISEAMHHVDRNSTDHNIKTVLSDDFLMAKMDSQLIMQVIVNIIDNAIKYTHKGSNITITAEKDEQYIRVEIADDGSGISDTAKEKLFDMFFTADNVRGDGRRGLGLGLSLCKSIILAHGGNIYVKDNAPKGTIFGFTLHAEEVNLNE